MTTTACTACENFLAGKERGSVRTGCRECSARSLAGGSLFFDSQKAGQILPAYRKALDRAFGGDVKAGHEAVKRWHAILNPQTKGTS